MRSRRVGRRTDAVGRSPTAAIGRLIAHFDLGELARRAEQRRRDCGLSLVELSAQIGVSPSTVRRWASADDAEADGVLAMVGWLAVPPEEFVERSVVDGVRLPPPDGGMIRVDMALVRQASAGAHAGTRTTIQRLVAVAQDAGRPVASLTRWSDV